MKSVAVFTALALEMARNRETQQTLAELIGVDRATVNRKMVGQREFTRSEMFCIAEHYGKTVDELFRI